MKRVIACTAVLAMVSGIAISDTPDSRDSLEFSDFRDSSGETRAFWQYDFGHAKTEVNGLRYGLRYDQSRSFAADAWRAPMLELVRNVDDALMPFEMNVSGLNVLDKSYMLNADGGIAWTPILTGVALAGFTAYAVSSSDEGDDPPKREETPDEGGGDDSSVGDVVGGVGGGDDSSVGDGVGGVVGLSVKSSSALLRSGGNGYLPSEPLAPHEVEALFYPK